MEKTQTAAMLVIGNELLSGKFEERNVAVLARLLFSLGIQLQRVVICPDEVDVIAEDLQRLSASYDHVFTSGGVGPTHDDVTMAGVAASFGRSIARHPELETLLREFFEVRLTSDHLRMADVPQGVELLWVEGVKWPVVRLENVFILPGLPEVFAMKMPVIRSHLQSGAAFFSRQVATLCDEGSMASPLQDLVDRFPEVRIGSYPIWGEEPRLVISFDGKSQDLVNEAAEALIAGIPADKLLEE